MNLDGAVASPALHRDEDEIGLLFHGARAFLFDDVQGTFRRPNDDAIRASACDHCDGFDDAEISVEIGQRAGVGLVPFRIVDLAIRFRVPHFRDDIAFARRA